MKYFINYSEEIKTVELWSTKRLPFEPKDCLKDMREDLRKDLKKLTRSREEVLYVVINLQLVKQAMVLEISFFTM